MDDISLTLLILVVSVWEWKKNGKSGDFGPKGIAFNRRRPAATSYIFSPSQSSSLVLASTQPENPKFRAPGKHHVCTFAWADLIFRSFGFILIKMRAT